ncbi:MAG: cytochrome c maturation protein CcmE [Rhodobacteraceae bacterium]|nr:cytochrome c maturation protein CcmE [Paracoccaceae bacterium]
MTGLKKRRRIRLTGLGFCVIAVAFGIIYVALGDAVQFFYSPSQVAENPPEAGRLFRLGGLIREGTLNKSTRDASFVVTDGGHSVKVVYTGVLPDLIVEGQGAIATGRMQGEIFVAREVLAKHDEKYMPKEIADALKEQGFYRPTQ